MLQILDEKVKRTPYEIEEQYPNSKYLLINFGDLQNPKGNLYCVSDSEDSFREINVLADDLAKKGVLSILGGSYDDWESVGVYEIEK